MTITIIENINYHNNNYSKIIYIKNYHIYKILKTYHVVKMIPTV